MTIEGIDVSSYQGFVNWRLVKQQGRKRFGIAKAVECGLDSSGREYIYHDPTFPHNWRAMNNERLPRGAYCFFHPSLDGRQQARALHQYVRECGGFHGGSTDFVMLDAESTSEYIDDAVPPDTVVQRLEDFVTTCWREINRPVVLYMGYYYWKDTLNSTTSRILTQCPLNVPSYGSSPLKPPPWPVISFWQYSWTGSVPGIVGNVDLDQFLGSPSQLREVLTKVPHHAG